MTVNPSVHKRKKPVTIEASRDLGNLRLRESEAKFMKMWT